MKKYKDHKQFRIPGYDYSQDGYYFVTICTHNKEFYFGEIFDQKMKLSPIGLFAQKCWVDITEHFPFVELDEFVIMPDHVHGIIIINNTSGNAPCSNGNASYAGRNAPWRVPTGIQPLIKNSLSSIVNHYKGGVKRYCNKNNLEYFKWQSRFYERIIRNEYELNNIRQYIVNNPAKWENNKNDILSACVKCDTNRTTI